MKAILILLACIALLTLGLAVSPSAGLSLAPGAGPVGPRLTPTQVTPITLTPRAWLPYIVLELPPEEPGTEEPTRIPTATATRTATATPTTPVATTPATGPCGCSANLYNCSDFSTHAQAQQCFDYCQAQGVGDIHQLDSDNDGSACEGLP